MNTHNAHPGEPEKAIRDFLSTHKSGLGRMISSHFQIRTLEEAEKLSTMLASHCLSWHLGTDLQCCRARQSRDRLRGEDPAHSAGPLCGGVDQAADIAGAWPAPGVGRVQAHQDRDPHPCQRRGPWLRFRQISRRRPDAGRAERPGHLDRLQIQLRQGHLSRARQCRGCDHPSVEPRISATARPPRNCATKQAGGRRGNFCNSSIKR